MDELLIRRELEELNQDSARVRLRTLGELYDKAIKSDSLPSPGEEVNNHVHSFYSFSPYNPSQAAYMAWRAGLRAVGVMDHDSFAGAGEMVEAGKILGMGSTCGVELRVSADHTSMEGRSLNNPGSAGIFYMAIHGIPLHQDQTVREFLRPLHEARNDRNRAMVDGLNKIIAEYDLSIDFDSDVYDYSMAAREGSITERHILAALSRKIIEAKGAGEGVVSFVTGTLGIPVPEKLLSQLSDPENPHYLYDLLGILKSEFLPGFFIQPNAAECPGVQKVVDFARSIGAIPAYAYLGDIEESVTGDKKAEKFEDSFLNELFEFLSDTGFLAVTYMPPRNTLQQLERVMGLCEKHNLMQISGVDINSSRQSFSSPEVLRPEFRHLNRSTWALIAHERISSAMPGKGLFGEKSLAGSGLSLNQRIEKYAKLGEQIDLHLLNVEQVVEKGVTQ